MKINKDFINEYRRLVQTTNLQQGYQEFIKFFRYLRTYLEGELNEYTFTGNIVENNMDYSYFQFTDAALKAEGLKIVVAFVHKEFQYEVWMSGVNRKIQNEYFNRFKKKQLNYTLTADPNRIDYILKKSIGGDIDYDDLDQQLRAMKTSITEFISDIECMVQ